MKDHVKFKEYMAALCEVHGREPLTKTLADIYWKALEPFPDAVCCDAFKYLILHSKFFPKPSEFLEILEGRDKDQSIIAWMKVLRALRGVGTYQSIEFDDHAIHSAIKTMGGWVAFGDILEKDLPWKQREFERIYNIVSRYRENHPGYLPGRTELQNFAAGYHDLKHEIVQIGFSEKEVRQIACWQ